MNALPVPDVFDVSHVAARSRSGPTPSNACKHCIRAPGATQYVLSRCGLNRATRHVHGPTVHSQRLAADYRPVGFIEWRVPGVSVKAYFWESNRAGVEPRAM